MYGLYPPASCPLFLVGFQLVVPVGGFGRGLESEAKICSPESLPTQSRNTKSQLPPHSSLSPGSSHCSYLVPSDLDTANCAPPLLALESRPSLVASLHSAHIFVNNAPGSLSDKKRKSIPNSRTALVSGNPSILVKSLILLLAFGRKPGSGGISCCFQRRGKRSYIFHTQSRSRRIRARRKVFGRYFTSRLQTLSQTG